MKNPMKIVLTVITVLALFGCEADGSGGGSNNNRASTPDTRVNDQDGDGIADDQDNCPTLANAMQDDTDGNGVGDVCETDSDGDTVNNDTDNCPVHMNQDQLDSDGDGVGDVCDQDTDTDGDTIDDGIDNCPFIFNPEQLDTDHDRIGNACDDDGDNDGIDNLTDNCPFTANADQIDTDSDGIGDACEGDRDGDGVEDSQDNCLDQFNPDQADLDQDGEGDICDDDRDGDAVNNDTDNCPLTANGNQQDTDGDGLGDVCDGGSTTPEDFDNDGVADINDNCPLLANGDQLDSDGDGQGDVCDNDGFTCAGHSTYQPITSATHTAKGGDIGGFGEPGICVGCSVDNPERIIDNDVGTFAQMNIGTAIVYGGAYVRANANDTSNNIDAKSVGFVVSDTTSPLLNIEILGSFITIRFYNDNKQVAESVVGGKLLDIDLLGIGGKTDQRFLVTEAPASEFDSVRLDYAGAFNLNKAFRVHNLCVESP